MNDEQRFDRTARTWLEDGPTRAPDRPVAAALAAITTTAQERDLRVPWRFSDMPMLLRVAAAAIVIAVIGGGALFFLSPADPGGVAAPSTAAPSPTATAMTVDAYVAARNAICDQAAKDTDPYKERFVGVFEGTLDDDERADAVAAFGAFLARYVVMIDDLAALEPPPTLAADDAEIVQAFRDILVNIQATHDGLRDRRDADALAADQATESPGDRITSWELQHVLHHCP